MVETMRQRQYSEGMLWKQHTAIPSGSAYAGGYVGRLPSSVSSVFGNGMAPNASRRLVKRQE
jgi:hypothetical protein